MGRVGGNPFLGGIGNVSGSATKREAACKLLGLDPTADHHDEHVKAAFAKVLKENHADNGGDGTMDMDALKQARNLLINHHPMSDKNATPVACKFCDGRGSVTQGQSFATVKCVACNGSGEFNGRY